ncbi:HlyD family secretion protein [Salegentibacter sediminis]|uniref:HlyD family secretion protein n=1 Tax=Salegentibacter sediminis TaxID=1930251 RepID=UPI0009BE20C4|nr:HlyD family efflux transporter periplasmic adaptor subunit [Salegentibacter sediminis]
MKRISIIITQVLLFGGLVSCSDEEKADGYGNFEATEITVSAEANGKIKYLNLEEGILLEKGELVGVIDTLQLHYSKKQLRASKRAVSSKSRNVLSQIGVLEEQLKTAKNEKERINRMYEEEAATKRQLDEVEGRVNVLEQQIRSVETQNAPILNELETLDVQIAKIEDQIEKSKIINPVKGTVLSKYAEPGEITAFGKPIYKIADLDEMTLRVFISETQLSEVKIGEEVNVKIDAAEGMKTFQGKVSWISSSAEFTPKIIQTKEERVNLVYAVKIKVKNDGSLKIGMPAEMWLE